jgi:hypothetical protein
LLTANRPCDLTALPAKAVLLWDLQLLPEEIDELINSLPFDRFGLVMVAGALNAPFARRTYRMVGTLDFKVWELANQITTLQKEKQKGESISKVRAEAAGLARPFGGARNPPPEGQRA